MKKGTEMVLVMRLEKRRPSFHRLGWGGNSHRTFCGYEWGGYEDRAEIPRRHAEKFSDPCKVCFR